MKVDAGKLDRSLTLLAAGSATTIGGRITTDELGQVVPDTLGQPLATFEEIATIRGQRLDIRTQDAAQAGGRETYSLARYLIRWRENISTDYRVETGGKTFAIKSIDEPDRRSTLILTLEEVTR